MNEDIITGGFEVVECPVCEVNSKIKEDVYRFVCPSCNSTLEKKENELWILTCPNCGMENKIVNNNIYKSKGAVCYHCNFFIPYDEKLVNKLPKWELKITGKDVAESVGIGIATVILYIVLGIFALFVLLCMFIVF